jgi:hypothetical protein
MKHRTEGSKGRWRTPLGEKRPLLTLADQILPSAEVVADLPAAPKDIRAAGLPYLLHCDKQLVFQPSFRAISGAAPTIRTGSSQQNEH